MDTSFVLEITMNDRHARIERECEQCGTLFMARVERVNAGQGRFCSRTCANNFQRQEASQGWGFDKGKKYWDGTRWNVQWKDESGDLHSTSYAYWWWALNVGEVPDGYVISYEDENPENISPDNFVLKLKADISRENGSKSDTTSYGFLGHKHTDENRKKISERQIGRKLPDEHRNKISKAIKMRWERGDFDNMVFRDISGDKNYFWRGGAGSEYPEGWNRRLKKFIWERDKNTCQICGKHVSPRGVVGHVHHIDGHKENLDYDNLILLCRSCHGKIHKSKDTSSPVIMAFRAKLYWNQ